jgi:hypothetical protein
LLLRRLPVSRRAHGVFAITPFQPSDGEMRARNLLKVVDESIVHGSAAECADNWHSLRRKRLGDNGTETGCDLW